jgi:hypothetical protein
MPISPIEQAIYGTEGSAGYRFLAQSPGFREEWLPEAERLCTGFGERPTGVACAECVFAQPFGPRHVAVVQVADQGADAAGRPGALGFRLLIVPKLIYQAVGADPFLIGDALPPPWRARGELPALEWTTAPPRRTIEALRQVLDVPYSATLLGGAQALLDGGRLVFERREPEPRLVRGLWALLPSAARAELWPASFAFGNAHGFDAIVVPRAAPGEFPGYLHEEQAGDYPEGRYELRLQTAVEAGDQDEVDALLSRRGRGQTLRLGFLLLAVMVLGPVAVHYLIPGPPAGPVPKAASIKAVPQLPRSEDCPPLSEWERRQGRLLFHTGQDDSP